MSGPRERARGHAAAVPKEEGDRIAGMVLALVTEMHRIQMARWSPALDVNVRPEPPEARLGFVP